MAPKKTARRVPARPKACDSACTKVIQFLNGIEVPANVGTSAGLYQSVDGFRFINVLVQFSQEQRSELPVDLGVMFAFDASGKMGARHYVNLEENLSRPQPTHMIEITGNDTWHGNPYNISTYVARLPIMGPFAQVIVNNRATVKRTVTVWAYLLS